MKRIALMLVALGAMGLFVACKKKENKPAEGAAPMESGAKPTDTAATAPADKPAEPAAAPADKPAEPAAAPADKPAEPAAAGGAAAGGEAASTGIAECDSYIKRLLACEKYPQAGKDALKQSTDAWKKASEAGGDAAKAAGDACKKAEEAADQSLKSMGC
jgi:hypothetical protein